MAKISDKVDLTNKMMESLVNHMMHPQPRATTSSSSQDPDLNDTACRFRVPVRPAISTPVEKNAKKDVLNMRVSGFHIINLILLQQHLLQMAVRKHANTMMRRTQNDTPEPAHKEAINKYKSTRNVEDRPSKDRFLPDFSKTHLEKSLWNIRLLEIFENDYVQEHLPIV